MQKRISDMASTLLEVEVGMKDQVDEEKEARQNLEKRVGVLEAGKVVSNSLLYSPHSAW